MAEYLEEVTSLTQNDCFLFFMRDKKVKFNFPVHKHPEYELNLILHGKGAKRVIGDHIGEIEDAELILVGSNLPHGWFTHKYEYKDQPHKIFEICIQFQNNLLDQSLLQRNQLFYLKDMLEKSAGGISFGEETIHNIKDKIINLSTDKGFLSVLELLTILHELSLSKEMVVLSTEAKLESVPYFKNVHLDKILIYLQTHFASDISLSQIAKVAGMTEVSFCRFVKKTTGKTFIDLLVQIRIGHASRMLIDTKTTISEIAFSCGFKNLSYFNRVFKSKKSQTPVEFRKEFHKLGRRTVV